MIAVVIGPTSRPRPLKLARWLVKRGIHVDVTRGKYVAVFFMGREWGWDK